MDIKHLEYFITIVDNNFNLSKAADVLYISQPALTKYIKDFESQEKVVLFVRYKGRLVELTPEGKEFYENAKTIVDDFHILMEKLHSPAPKSRGTVRLGVPPMVINMLFQSAIPKFVEDNPDIELKIVEAGASELQKMLLTQEIDLAFLIEPIILPNISYRRIHANHMVAVFRNDHELAKTNDPLSYKKLEYQKCVIFDKTFMLHDQILKNFRLAAINPEIIFQFHDWELLVDICERMNTITFLPRPSIEQYPRSGLTYRLLSPDFPWNVVLTKLNNVYHSEIILYTEDYFSKSLDYIYESSKTEDTNKTKKAAL